jgi:hypothetical protein
MGGGSCLGCDRALLPPTLWALALGSHFKRKRQALRICSMAM